MVVKLEGSGQGGLPLPEVKPTKQDTIRTPLTVTVSATEPRASSIYANLKVGGFDTKFLVDSGAEVTLIPDSHPVVSQNRSLLEAIICQPVTLDGKPISVCGRLKGEVEINGNRLPVRFVVTSDSRIPPILGTDVMMQLDHMEIDFKSNTAKFGPKKVSFIQQKESVSPRVYRVKLDREVTLPPKHEMMAMGMISAHDQHDLSSLSGKTLIMEPVKDGGKEIACARSIVCVDGGKIPVRICNPFANPVVLHSGMSLGNAELLPESCPMVAVMQDVEEDIALMSAEDPPRKTAEEVMSEICERSELSDDEKRMLKEFLITYSEAFSVNGEIGRYSKHPFTIDTGDARPIRQMPRPVPHHQKAEVDRQLDDMLQKGIIKPSSSDWASPILMVRKADGSLRFCLDYRRVNAVTKHDAYPLPNVNDCLSSLGPDSCMFSHLDLASGYWQVEAHPETQEKLAFTTHRGLFQPVVQPFGPRGGVAHFSRIMSALLGSLQWHMLLIYLDDLLIFSRTFEEHLSRLGMVFKILIEANLKLKPSKCSIGMKSVNFLGHKISAAGVTPSEEKVSAVSEWSTPSNLEEVRKFLGFASFYRSYVPGFADKAEPLHRLTRKKVEFTWDSSCERSFKMLKDCLVSKPVMAHPDFSIPFILTTDASATGLGAVLSQVQKGKERPIAYASRSLNAAEKNYSTTERECLACVWATDHFRYYLAGAEFILQTDHNPLVYLQGIKEPQGRLARWILKLEQYKYKMVYKAGKDIPHADSLSRQAPSVAVMKLPFEFDSTIWEEAQDQDTDLQKVRRYVRLGRLPLESESRAVKDYFKKMDARVVVEQGLLFIKGQYKRKPIRQLIVPKSLVHRVLEKGHDEGGHLGEDRTLETIRMKFYWSTMFRDVKQWCSSCKVCQLRKHPRERPRAPLQYPPIASKPGQVISLDFVGPLPETPRGNKHILVITDMYSKFAEALPLPDQTAETTAGALWKGYFCRQGLPEILHSDQGRNFEAAVIQHLCVLLNIRKTRTSPYHPSGNGQCERYNKTLIELISMQMKSEDQTDWDQWIPMMLFAYHSTIHSSTGYTPFQLHMGRQPRTPFDTLADTMIDTKHKSAQAYLKEIQSQMSEIHRNAQGHLLKAMETRKRTHDRKLNFRQYAKGDMVLLRQLACKPGLKPKLIKERWTGPWKVDQVRGPVNYRIVRKGNKGKKERILVHHDRLKPFQQRPKHLETDNADGLGESETEVTPEVPKRENSGASQHLEQVLDSDDDSESDDDEEERPDRNHVEGEQPENQAQNQIRVEVEQDQGERQPLMGHDGRTWCNVDMANTLPGSRRSQTN